MKVLTLTQPWATLVAIGAKRYETRSWATRYRGPLAIHAAKGFPRHAQDLMLDEPFKWVLARGGYTDPEELPRGVIVAQVELVGCFATEGKPQAGALVQPALFEAVFGFFGPGRYAWALDKLRRLERPVPARGRQGLWDFEGEL